MSVYKKILAVMQDVEYLKKDDRVNFEVNGRKTDYKAISEEKVTSAVGEAMRKHGLVIIPYEQEHSKEGNLTTVNVKYKLVDVDTGEHEYAVSSGTGVDTQDKGVGKAMTYAYKYLLLRTFAIPTGEDPDKVSSAELDSKLGNKQPDPIQDDSKLVSQKQVGLIKTLVKKIATSRGVKDEEVYTALKVADITTLTSKQASGTIETLNKWVGQANQKEGA